MLWMETYLLYFSVRLGVLVISVIAFLSTFIPSILLFVMGLDLFNPILKVFNDDAHFRKHFVVKKITDMVDSDSNKLLVLFHLYFFAHMTASALAFYGSWKIKKYYLLPLAIFDFCRVLYCLGAHILLMTVCKNKFNLGMLITATLGGGFLILFLGYNWAAIVALYQIITLINSERYKTIYGDDPFQPLIPKTYNPLITENVRVLVTPQSRDIDDQKRRNMINGRNVQPIIAVIPANYAADSNKWNWRNYQEPLVAGQVSGTRHAAAGQEENVYNQSVNYNYWQWSEMTPAVVSARNKRNIYKGSHFRY